MGVSEDCALCRRRRRWRRVGLDREGDAERAAYAEVVEAIVELGGGLLVVVVVVAGGVRGESGCWAAWR